MKKLAAFILILVSLAALAGCGAPPVPPAASGPSQDSSSDGTAAEAVHASDDGTGAPASEEAGADAEPSPVPAREIVEVEITTDNFFDYFEFVEFPEGKLETHTNPDGTLTAIIAPSAFYLKEGYEVAAEKADMCSLEAHVKYMRNAYYYVERAVRVDLPGCSYDILRKTPNEYSSLAHDEQIKGTCEDGQYFVYIGSDTVLFATTVKIIENIKLLSASGTLYLYG